MSNQEGRAQMDWRPLTRDELQGILERELAECSDEQRGYFKTVAFEPMKWSQSPYGDDGGGFWAIAADDHRVLWYNDIEEGFNVSSFTARGTIPANEYWCNQDKLKFALPALMVGQISKAGPPQPLDPSDSI
jgi:hypothetical protein